MTRKSISDQVKKKLFTMSGNQCCFPDCEQKLYDRDENVLLGEMCHINGVNPTAARYDSSYSDDVINSYENLLLMCPSHHSIIDGNEAKYNVEELIRLKKIHEDFFYDKDNFLKKFEEGAIDTDEAHILLKIIEQLGSKNERNQILPEKNIYEKPLNYIKRSINAIRQELDFNFIEMSMEKVISNEDRIVLLGVAGSGKSIELQNIAYLNSKETTNYYPVKVRLNDLTSESIEDFLLIEYPKLLEVPKEKLLIILDALDEVHTDELDKATSRIGLFSKKYRLSKIIISCRNNFYITETAKRRGKLDGFKSFYLNPLDEKNIKDYINNKILSNPNKFINHLNEKKYFSLLYSPFYLVNLVSLYKNRGELPETKKEVFEYLINERIEEDLDKFKNSGLRIGSSRFLVEKTIEKLAITAEALGRNHLTINEFHTITDNDKLIPIIEKTFLFNKSNRNENWQFEHNNFQEFLAAKYMSNLNLDVIKELTSFKPNYLKIKPSWLNTISFLFSILESNSKRFKNLYDWIFAVEPDILIRFEKDKIQLKEREKIFKDIYESYDSKGIIIRNEKFESEDLALFVSDSKETIKYLIQKAKASKEMVRIIEAIRILPNFEYINEFKVEITAFLTKNLLDDEIAPQVKYDCFRILYDLNINTPSIIQEFLISNKIETSQYLRSGLYYYIGVGDFQEEYIDLLLDGIPLLGKTKTIINKDSEKTETEEANLYSEGEDLKFALKKIDSLEGLFKILEWIIDSKDKYDDLIKELIKSTIPKLIEKFEGNENDILNRFIDFLISFERRDFYDLDSDIRLFFLKTNTGIKTYDKIIAQIIVAEETNNRNLTLSYVLGLAFTKNCINYVIDKIKTGIYSDDIIFLIRNAVNWHSDKNIDQEFYLELTNYNKVFKYPEKIDHEKLRELRRVNDLRLLMSRVDFKKEVVGLFNEYSSKLKTFTKDDLWDYKKSHFNDAEMTNEIVVRALRELIDNSENVELAEAIEFIEDDERWNWFVIQSILDRDINIQDFTYSSKVKKFCKQWTLDNLKKADFKSALRSEGSGQIYYRYLETFLPYLIRRLDIDLSEETYLDMTLVESNLLMYKTPEKTQLHSIEFRIIDYIESKVGKQKLLDRLIQNLKEYDLIERVKIKHFKFLAINSDKRVVDFIFQEFSSNCFNDYDKKELVDIYIDLNGNLQQFTKLIHSFDEDLCLHSLKQLIKANYFEVELNCIKKLDSELSEDYKLLYIDLIGEINLSKSITYLKEWIIRNKKFPDTFKNFKKFNKLKHECIDDILEFIDYSFKEKFGNGIWSNRRDYISIITELGSKSKSSFKKVKSKFESWANEYKDAKFIFYQVQTLEQLYYEKKSQSLSLSEIEGLLKNNIVRKQNLLVNFWENNKLIIEIISFIIGLIGLLAIFL